MFHVEHALRLGFIYIVIYISWNLRIEALLASAMLSVLPESSTMRFDDLQR